MESSNQPLDYRVLAAQYQDKFGVRPPKDLLKSVSLMMGTDDLCRALQEAILCNQAMDFDAYAKAFFESLGAKLEETAVVA